tara:strand:- start:35 stop:466 length:432 start_codon:yes stop_codon:yes gene_type:complete
MGFKLGKQRGNYAVAGEIKTKMRFGRQAGDEGSVPGTPVIRVPLEEGVKGEANMDGTIFISDKIIPGSFEDKQTINHEMRHATDMRIGKLSYEDDYITYNGEVFERKTIKGKDMINIYGEWKEAGSHDFPWEVEANNGNDEYI